MTGEMAQRVGRLLCKYEDLCLSLGPVLKARHRHVKTYNPGRVGKAKAGELQGLAGYQYGQKFK